MSCQHCPNFPDIAQEESRDNIEQKDKIVRNNTTTLIMYLYSNCHFLIHYLQYINVFQYLHYLQLVFSFLKISFFFRSLCSLLNSANLPHSGLFTVVAFPGYNSIFAFLNQFCLSYPDFYGIYLYGILRGSQP